MSDIKLSNLNYFVFKMNEEHNEQYNELVISHITRLLDLPGIQLDRLRQQVNFKAAVDSSKLQTAWTKSRDFLSRKDTTSSFHYLSSNTMTRIEQLINFLNSQLTTEEIFLKDGEILRQEQLLRVFDIGTCIDFEKSQFTALDVANVLKTILSQLSEPALMPSHHFDAHVQISEMNLVDTDSISNKRKRIEALQLLMLLLPSCNRKTIQSLLKLLFLIAKHQKVNKMSAAKLGAVFAPILITPRTQKEIVVTENLDRLNEHLAFMIRHVEKIFVAPFYIRHSANSFFASVAANCQPDLAMIKLVPRSCAMKRAASDVNVLSMNQSKSVSKVSCNDFHQLRENSVKKFKLTKSFRQSLRKRSKTSNENVFKAKEENAIEKKHSYCRYSQPGDESLPLADCENENVTKTKVVMQTDTSQTDPDTFSKENNLRLTEHLKTSFKSQLVTTSKNAIIPILSSTPRSQSTSSQSKQKKNILKITMV